MASMCSTQQPPRAANAFSRACAARTCPAPDDAESSRTRGFAFMRERFRRRRFASRSLAAPGSEFFKHSARDLLQLAEAHQVILELVVELFGFFRPQLRAQDHVAQFHGMRQQRVLLQLLERGSCVVVIHGVPRVQTWTKPLYSHSAAARELHLMGKARWIYSRGRRRGRQKFVAFNPRGDASATAGGGFEAHNLAVAADIDVAGLRNLLRPGNDEFNFTADGVISVGKEI